MPTPHVVDALAEAGQREKGETGTGAHRDNDDNNGIEDGDKACGDGEGEGEGEDAERQVRSLRSQVKQTQGVEEVRHVWASEDDSGVAS